ncbi:MAG: hypothetical protein QY318_02430 [Candidatus Dojkabacteria bacterium]|nr:MAG: hypothetical protein QY318_02430 [Candidatus Dojkabacteria bacterium]
MNIATNLKQTAKSIATLEAIISPNWESRYYSYNSKWAEGEEMFSMRNGSGDEFYILFTNTGVVGKFFLHENPTTVEIPQDGNSLFPTFFTEPAFEINNATFFLWKKESETEWHSQGGVDERILKILDGRPEAYKQWADGYYEKNLNLDTIRAIYDHAELTDDLIHSLNPDLSRKAITEELAEIGY